jgi:hypothetical protein
LRFFGLARCRNCVSQKGACRRHAGAGRHGDSNIAAGRIHLKPVAPACESGSWSGDAAQFWAFEADGRYERFKTTKFYDGDLGRQQHGYPTAKELPF